MTLGNDLKDVFTIKIKNRDDNIGDQYSRIFMMKVFLICSIICGVSWYSDKFNCIVPESMSTFKEFPKFVGSTCWIQGVYIYRELEDRMDEVSYYGMPYEADMDGIRSGSTDLCKTVNRRTQEINKNCTPMKKTFYLQYQYMPFLVAALGLLFYVPRMIHKVANNDIIKLSEEIHKDDVDMEKVFKTHFVKVRGPRGVSNTKGRLTTRHLMIFFVRACYVAVNVAAFVSLNILFNGQFLRFGTKWWDWSRQNNTMRFDYMGSNRNPRPANALLPPFGYCELYSGAKDVKETHYNKHKMVCELSQHVLYQYVLMLLWALLITGIIISALCLVLYIVKVLIGILGLRTLERNPDTKVVFKRLTDRQIDYLEYLKSQDVLKYGDIISKLSEEMQNGGLQYPEKNKRSSIAKDPLITDSDELKV